VRLKARRGPKKAIVAVAASMLTALTDLGATRSCRERLLVQLLDLGRGCGSAGGAIAVARRRPPERDG
jgi:hypothetical protein